MPGFTPPGNNVNSRVVFNSGTIDFGNTRIIDIDNIALTIEWTTLPLMILGSIKPQDLVRHSQKTSLSGKLKSYPEEMDMIVMGSSAIGSPNQAITLDGQPTFQNPVVTLFDRNGKEYQYQFINAIFKSNKLTAKMEDYAEWDFELDSVDILELMTQ
jgi:hypothetical protein